MQQNFGDAKFLRISFLTSFVKKIPSVDSDIKESLFENQFPYRWHCKKITHSAETILTPIASWYNTILPGSKQMGDLLISILDILKVKLESLKQLDQIAC